MPASNNQKRCFVVMGFGIKTDYATGRKLDLDKTYRLLIKPVVEQKQLICVRADEIFHTGSIDERMYQELLRADVVIADLSTANLNAFYELGIRHALRPHTTVVISEDKLSYPFDLNHVKITSYTHLGDAIDYEEVERFREVLSITIDTVLKEGQTDSPVYTYLKHLVPPALQEQTAEAVDKAKEALAEVTENITQAKNDEQEQDTNPKTDLTLAVLIEQGEQALKRKEYLKAKAFFSTALHIGKETPESNIVNNDSYLIHRMVLATYKAKVPDEIAALHEAFAFLKQLSPEDSNDPETVAVAGAIEKRLYEKGAGEKHLAQSIKYYERGYYLRNDTYNGINLAFMLNCRAASSLDATVAEQIADMVWANRFRIEVLAICEKELQNIQKREGRKTTKVFFAHNYDLVKNQEAYENEHKFWTLVNKAEAHVGLGEIEHYEAALAEAQQVEHTDWMWNSFVQQVEKLGQLLEKTKHVLSR